MIKQKLHVNNVSRWPNLTKKKSLANFFLNLDLIGEPTLLPIKQPAHEKLKIKLNKKYILF